MTFLFNASIVLARGLSEGRFMPDKKVAHFNVEHFRKLLTAEMDEAKRQTILRPSHRQRVAGGAVFRA